MRFTLGEAGIDLDKTIDEAITAAVIGKERRSRRRMIGLDTNVLLRLFVEDDPQQSDRARGFFEAASASGNLCRQSGRACRVRLDACARFRKKRREVAHLIAEVLSADDLEFRNRSAAERALTAYRSGKADFPDYFLAEINLELGCASTATFDQRRAQIIPPSPPCRETRPCPLPATPLPPTSLPRAHYAEMFGPTTGDRIRLADTELIIEVEKDFTTYGEEVKFGGGKVIRDGMGQAQTTNARGAVDTVITNAVILDHWGIVKADVGPQGRAHRGDRQGRQSGHPARRHHHRRARAPR